jgi:hypothetical protein
MSPQLMALLTRRPWDAWQRILKFLRTQARTVAAATSADLAKICVVYSKVRANSKL